jgi:hypothetical protein
LSNSFSSLAFKIKPPSRKYTYGAYEKVGFLAFNGKARKAVGAWATKKPLPIRRGKLSCLFLSLRTFRPAGIGTFASCTMRVAGFHRASPSTTLDKKSNTIIQFSSLWIFETNNSGFVMCCQDFRCKIIIRIYYEIMPSGAW